MQYMSKALPGFQLFVHLLVFTVLFLMIIQGVCYADSGDVNSDSHVDISDLIISLQVLSGIPPAHDISGFSTSDADVNNDGTIGIEEAIYILRRLAGLTTEYDNQTMEGIWLINYGTDENYDGYFIADHSGTIIEPSMFNQIPSNLGDYQVQPDGSFIVTFYSESETNTITGRFTSLTSAVFNDPYNGMFMEKLSDVSLGADIWSGTLVDRISQDSVDVIFSVDQNGHITSFNNSLGPEGSNGRFFVENGKATGFIHTTGLATPWDQIKLVGSVNGDTYSGYYGLNNGSPDDDGDANLSKETVVYKIATEAGYVPFEYLDGNNQLAGFDIDLMNAISTEGGFNIEFINTSWSTIFDDVSSGLYDAAIAAITITPARIDLVNFSSPYINSGKVIMVLAENQSNINTSNDLNNKQVGVASSSANTWLSNNTTANITVYQDIDELFTALSTSEVEGIVHEGTLSAAYLKDHSQINAVIIEEIFEEYSIGISVNKDRSELLQTINSALTEILSNGAYDAIYDSYFSDELFKP